MKYAVLEAELDQAKLGRHTKNASKASIRSKSSLDLTTTNKGPSLGLKELQEGALFEKDI